jgi:hypothetical protein
VTPIEWEQVAAAIQDRFPRENSTTYFTKSRKETNTAQSGKLHGYYTNKRGELKRVGLIGEPLRQKAKIYFEPQMFDDDQCFNLTMANDVTIKEEEENGVENFEYGALESVEQKTVPFYTEEVEMQSTLTSEDMKEHLWIEDFDWRRQEATDNYVEYINKYWDSITERNVSNNVIDGA